MKVVRDWWGKPDHFDWLSDYLQARSMARSVRLFFGTITMSFCLLPFDGWLRRGNFDEAVPIVLEMAVATAGFVIGVLWFRGWPSKAQSLIFALFGSSTTALWSMLQSDHLFGLLICTTLTFSGGYFALLHSPPCTLFNLLLAAAASSVNAIQLAAGDGDVVHAVVGLWIVLAMNTIAPLAAQTLCRALGADLSASEHDPLTGLRNRRTLYCQVAAMTQNPGHSQGLRVTMVDLDNFKRLNDSHGHTTGDGALVEVARILRESVNDNVMWFRFGGEEFLAIEVCDLSTPSTYPEVICKRIAELPYKVSASVGSIQQSIASQPIDKQTVDALINRADIAMYEAKRCGGNSVRRS